MIPGEHLNANVLRRMPTLDDYGIKGYKASAARIEEVHAKIVKSSFGKMEDKALVCKGRISHYDPLLTEP